METIEACTASGIRTLLGFTAMSRNIHELPALIDLAAEWGVFSLEVMPLMPAGRAYLNRDHDTLSLTPEQQSQLETWIEEGRRKYNNRPIIHLSYTFDKMLGWIRNGMPNIFLHICADGNIKIVPQISVAFGNLYTQSLDEIWSGGLQTAWSNPAFQRYVSVMTSTYDVDSQSRIPYIDKDITMPELEALV
jgi:hypothetical protein